LSTFAHLLARQSTASRNLREPGPDAQQLHELLRVAMHVPDHGQLAPWRFLLIQGDARQRLSEKMLARKRALEPHATGEALEKERMRFLYAPSIVTVICAPITPHKVPVSEQLLSAGAVCMQLLNAACAAGFRAQWLTGWAAYDAEIAAFLGLSGSESITGFIHIGHSDAQPNVRARPALADKLRSL
jgi:nitroreductase